MKAAPADHASVKDGKWREPILIEMPYERDPGDDEAEQDRLREKAYIGSAAYEQDFRRGL